MPRSRARRNSGHRKLGRSRRRRVAPAPPFSDGGYRSQRGCPSDPRCRGKFWQEYPCRESSLVGSVRACGDEGEFWQDCPGRVSSPVHPGLRGSRKHPTANQFRGKRSFSPHQSRRFSPREAAEAQKHDTRRWHFCRYSSWKPQVPAPTRGNDTRQRVFCHPPRPSRGGLRGGRACAGPLGDTRSRRPLAGFVDGEGQRPGRRPHEGVQYPGQSPP